MKWYKSKAGLIIVILFGVFMFVYGEYDDSPGGQLLGLLAVIIGIVGMVIRRKKSQY
ncbi:MAG: hypothetical protein WC768_01585 [Patescibacteria group bacterium]|jgi:multisubunit Na+/H+ antiporter MnhB subunit